MKFTPDKIESLSDNKVFVFGSNLAGIHGAGAARTAVEKFGARYGQGIGIQGMSYAIPTKDKYIESLPLSEIQEHVKDFIDYAKQTPDVTFFVTEIGCGLAGFEPKDIAPMFKEYSVNVVLPERFFNELQVKHV